MQQETIVKCFRKGGILLSPSTVVSRGSALEDPFREADHAMKMPMEIAITVSLSTMIMKNLLHY